MIPSDEKLKDIITATLSLRGYKGDIKPVIKYGIEMVKHADFTPSDSDSVDEFVINSIENTVWMAEKGYIE